MIQARVDDEAGLATACPVFVGAQHLKQGAIGYPDPMSSCRSKPAPSEQFGRNDKVVIFGFQPFQVFVEVFLGKMPNNARGQEDDYGK